MRGRRGTVVAVAVAVALLAVAVWLTRPVGDGVALDPRGTDARGTAAMFRVVEQVGADVTIAADPPAGADQTIVVLADRLDDQRREQVRERVRDGARLVLFDPLSPLNPAQVEGRLATDVLGVLGEAPRCDVLDGVVDRVESARWALLTSPEATARCFPFGDGYGLVATPLGDGEVVVTGAVDALVNRELGDADHGRLAVALLAPSGSGQVTVLWDTEIGGGDVALLDLVPGGVKVAFWVLVGAVVLYALARARRLGRPVPERLPVRVPASELALSIGDLLGRGGHREAAAARLRADLRREVAVALHVPSDTPPDVLVELLAERAGDRLDGEGLRLALLDGPVPDDRALVAVTAALARVRDHLHAAPAGSAGPDR